MGWLRCWDGRQEAGLQSEQANEGRSQESGVVVPNARLERGAFAGLLCAVPCCASIVAISVAPRLPFLCLRGSCREPA